MLVQNQQVVEIRAEGEYGVKLITDNVAELAGLERQTQVIRV